MLARNKLDNVSFRVPSSFMSTRLVPTRKNDVFVGEEERNNSTTEFHSNTMIGPKNLGERGEETEVDSNQ